MTNIPAPAFVDSVDLRYFIEPLNASQHPLNYLTRFPDSLYNKAPDSHFIRFMYTLLGPAGVGWLRDNYTAARLQLEQNGLDLFNLDAFYGDPFAFGRIVTENFNDDITGLLTNATWAAIRARDERYRSRAIEYMNAARLGTTPKGMALAAASGIGQDVEVIENYHSLFDQHCDDPLGLPSFGSSGSLGEWIILPMPAISRTVQQTIRFEAASLPLGTNTWTITFNGFTTGSLSSSIHAPAVQTALQSLPTIGLGNVAVTGGPYPSDFTVTFQSTFSNQSLPTLQPQFTDSSSGLLIDIPVQITVGAINPNSETVVIPEADLYSMQVAIDHLRPVATYPTVSLGRSNLQPQNWAGVVASTEHTNVLLFATGSPSVMWPPVDSTHWIIGSTEVEAPQLQTGAAQHYVNFHNIAGIQAYTDQALQDPNYATNSAVLSSYNSVHVGPFPEMHTVLPFFRQFDQSFADVFSAPRALASYPTPLAVTAQSSDGTAYINGAYPADYLNLPGVPTVTSNTDNFWSSRSRASGSEILEIDLGSPQAVNFISMEVTLKPITLAVDYDLSDQAPARTFAPVAFIPGFPNGTSVFYDSAQQNPWTLVQFYFNDGQALLFTRFIRLTFTRQVTDTTFGGFLFNPTTHVQTPWSIDVRNLRIGRNLPPQTDQGVNDDSGLVMAYDGP